MENLSIRHSKGQNVDIGGINGDPHVGHLIDNICKLARNNNYQSVSMPIISGGIFVISEITMGAALVKPLIRKTDRTNLPKVWTVWLRKNTSESVSGSGCRRRTATPGCW